MVTIRSAGIEVKVDSCFCESKDIRVVIVGEIIKGSDVLRI